MFDEQGRVWFTSRVRPPENPAFCRKGSDSSSAKFFPLDRSNRHLSMYDPRTGQFTLISTCFPTHHLVFASDANNTLWTSAGGPGSGVVGWLNRRMLRRLGTRRKHKAGRRSSWTLTATASAMNMSNPISPSIRQRTSGSQPLSTA